MMHSNNIYPITFKGEGSLIFLKRRTYQNLLEMTVKRDSSKFFRTKEVFYFYKLFETQQDLPLISQYTESGLSGLSFQGTCTVPALLFVLLTGTLIISSLCLTDNTGSGKPTNPQTGEGKF